MYLIKYKGDVIKNNVFEKGYAHGSITIPIDKAEITKISEIFISELRDSVDTYNKNEDFIFSLINTNKIEDLIRDFCRLRCIGCTIIPYKGNMLIELRL